MKTFDTLGLIVMACVAVAYGAAAEPRASSSARSAAVYTADLNPEAMADARVLYERIAYAAHALCTANQLSFDVKRQMRRRECMAAAVESAVARANSPLLTAVHLQERAQLARL